MANKLWNILKSQLENCPVVLLLIASWSILPTLCRFLVIGFILQILIYGAAKWKYKWASPASKLSSKKFLKRCHWVYLAFLVLIPVATMAAYHFQKEVPKQLDNFVLSEALNQPVSNSVVAFVFSKGNPHPTNYGTSYLGIVSPTETRLFESGSFFSVATARYIEWILMLGFTIWIFAWLALYVLGLSEAIAETMQPSNNVGSPSQNP